MPLRGWIVPVGGSTPDRLKEGGRLGPLLFSALERGRAGFEIHRGAWFDIGHPESLARARREWIGRDFPEPVPCRSGVEPPTGKLHPR